MDITTQLKKYAHGIIGLGELTAEAFNALNEIFESIDTEDDAPIKWDSRDFKEWLESAFNNGIYNKDNLE